MSTVEQVSTEAVKYQGRSALYKDLTTACQQAMDIPVGSADSAEPTYDLVLIEELIKKHTGLPFTLKIEKFTIDRIYMTYPPIDLKHPFTIAIKDALSEGNVGFFYQQRAVKKAKLVAKEYRGMIDLDKSRVTGALTNFHSTIYIPYRIFDGFLSAGEIASLLLHEIGHAFTYLEKLLDTASTNFTILSAWYDYADVIDAKQKMKILDETFADLNVKNVNSKELDVINNKEEFMTVVLSSRQHEIRSLLNSSKYDYTAIESIADQFAFRHGAAPDLMTALDKINRRYGYSVESDVRFANVGTAVIVGFIAVMIYVAPWLGVYFLMLVLAVLLSIDTVDQLRCDTPVERIDRAIADLIQASKRMQRGSVQARDIASQITSLQMMRPIMKENDVILLSIWRNLKPSRMRQFKAKEFQKQLEELINNRLYVQSILLHKLAKS